MKSKHIDCWKKKRYAQIHIASLLIFITLFLSVRKDRKNMLCWGVFWWEDWGFCLFLALLWLLKSSDFRRLRSCRPRGHTTDKEDKCVCSKTLIWMRGGLFNSFSLILVCLWAVRPMCILSTLAGLWKVICLMCSGFSLQVVLKKTRAYIILYFWFFLYVFRYAVEHYVL